MEPGGYSWWYVDAASDDGAHALTIIGFVGSVFSPYYSWSGRTHPENHCAVNVALYGRGARWTMTERGKSALTRDADALEVGRSRMAWAGDHLRIDVDERAAPVPFPVRGCVRVYPEALQRREFALDPDARHVWRPIAPRARVEATFREPQLSWSGGGYFDCNAGIEPLESGFARWTWARTHLPDGEAVIHYDAHRRDGGRTALALRFDATGEPAETAFPDIARMPTGFWGVGRAAASEGDARLVRVLEDSPFYTRSEIEITVAGKPRLAMHESLDLDRFAASWVKLLLPFRMPRLGFL